MSTDLSQRQLEHAPMPEQQEENSWAFIAFAWRRKWIVLLLVAIGLGLGYLYYSQQVPIYQSSSQLLIVKERRQLPVEGVEISQSYDRTHEALIRSPRVLEKAVELLDLDSLESLRGLPPDAAVGRLMRNLSVNVGGGETGDILVLNYKSRSREDCPVVLNAVSEAYEEYLGGTYKQESQEALRLIQNAKEQLDKEITAGKEEYREFRNDSELLFTGEAAQNVHESRLQQIESQRTQAMMENTRLQAEINALEQAMAEGGSREALNLMVGHLKSRRDDLDPTDEDNLTRRDATIEERIFPLVLQEQDLLERYGSDHPKVRAVRRRINLTREYLLGQSKRDIDSSDSPRDFLDIYLESLEEKIKLNEEEVAHWDELFQKERAAAKTLANAHVQDEVLSSQIARKEQLYNTVIGRLEEISLTQDTKGTQVDMIYPPGVGIQVEPDIQRVMLASGMLGLLAGLGLAFLVDSADRRFRTPEEVRDELGLPIVGHIPVLPSTESNKKKKKKDEAAADVLDPQLRTHHQPRGRIAEAYRAVRTALYFSTRGSHQVVQVTSPSPGDGKTTLAGNLALSIAQSGKRVLLVDGDFRRPRVHRLFGAKNEGGMSNVIDGSAELDDVIQQTPVENLELLPCGKRPKNPAELLSSKRFDELLELLREKYDLVIIDTPPVLAVTDPLNVAPRVDGLLLVLRLTKNARTNGRRALDALDGLGANIFGVVINGVGGPSGYGGYGYGTYGQGGYGQRYGYGGYRYGYGSDYAYRYSYADDYSDKYDENAYYEEDDDGRVGTGSPSANGKE